jgi:hypothetical protein
VCNRCNSWDSNFVHPGHRLLTARFLWFTTNGILNPQETYRTLTGVYLQQKKLVAKRKGRWEAGEVADQTCEDACKLVDWNCLWIPAPHAHVSYNPTLVSPDTAPYHMDIETQAQQSKIWLQNTINQGNIEGMGMWHICMDGQRQEMQSRYISKHDILICIHWWCMKRKLVYWQGHLYHPWATCKILHPPLCLAPQLPDLALILHMPGCLIVPINTCTSTGLQEFYARQEFSHWTPSP